MERVLLIFCPLQMAQWPFHRRAIVAKRKKRCQEIYGVAFALRVTQARTCAEHQAIATGAGTLSSYSLLSIVCDSIFAGSSCTLNPGPEGRAMWALCGIRGLLSK